MPITFDKSTKKRHGIVQHSPHSTVFAIQHPTTYQREL